MHMKPKFFTAAMFLVAVTCSTSIYAAGQKAPKLILQITVDALRGDLPYRFRNVLGEGGFRYLMEQGINYTNANYQHANTETIVGHVSLATGTVPAAHGMVGNVWFDRAQDRLVYNIEDPRYRLLTGGADVDRKTEIDPTQRKARSDGRSPDNILTSTFSDELAIHFAGRSKIFGVSVKDRGAVSMAGHAGKAFWFSKKGAEFVTSTYYYAQYPDWVNEWNAREPASAYAGKAWELTHPPSRYLFGDADDREYEVDLAGFGRTFPHPYGKADDRYFTTKLTLSPAGDELSLDFAKTLLDKEQLGQDAVPDYLAVSSTALRTGSLSDNQMTASILRNYYPKRSGDIYLVFEPNVFINDFDGLTVSSTHGSPWRYDTFVPVMFAGAGLPAARVSRPVTPYDIAPTLAAFLKLNPPSGAIGMPLPEVLGQ